MILFPILLSVLGGIFLVVLGFSRWIPADRETYGAIAGKVEGADGVGW